MKKLFNLALLFAAASSLLFVGCDPEEEKKDDPTSTIEARIKSIMITNGGISGGDRYTGVIDEASKTVTFEEVAAETNIAAVKFETTLSLGAHLDAETYDFTNAADPTASVLTQTVTVINGEVAVPYAVTLNLKAPEKAPLIDRLVMKDENGNTARANVIDNLLLLSLPEATSATIEEIVLTPARATCEFTTMTDGVLSASNPGKFIMEFMGLKTEYEVSFSSSPTAGADFSEAIVHDFSVATENVYPLYPGELVRGADFDGKYVLIADRATPEVHRIEDLLNDNTGNAIKLDLTGVEGGTHMISSGKLSHGHVYLCNLPSVGVSTTIGNGPLRVYHYATPESKPEVVLEWAGTNAAGDTIYTGRLGDNISVNLDEGGNGYVYFSKQEPGDKIFRFTVTNFTQFSDPFEINPPAIASYYGFYNQVGENQYLFTSSYTSPLWLMDANGTVLSEIELGTTTNDARLAHGCDPHIITFNRARYLIFTVANSLPMHWNFGPVLYLMDITEGNDVVSALTKLNDAMWPLDEEAVTVEPAYSYFLDPTGATNASACVAHANAAEVNGKLVIFTSAANAGFAIIEVPKAK